MDANFICRDQCLTITGEAFDREELEDGHIYFLNTKKLAKDKSLVKHSDKRRYTIWETLQNTARRKGERLYFIIDEAHCGVQGRLASEATSIMQRFIKGYVRDEINFAPMPLVIGMSATTDRFDALVKNVDNLIVRYDGGETYSSHLFAKDDGTVQIKLNGWEKFVIREEGKNPDLVCWLRNSGGKWGLCIPYEQNGVTKAMYPDFLLVSNSSEGYVLDILEPHGGQFADSLAKAKGLARYAQEELAPGRILLIREKTGRKGQYHCLDMTRHEVRTRVLAMNDDGSLEDVFTNLGEDYPDI